MLETVFSITNFPQFAIENAVSNVFLSTFVDCSRVFDCPLPGRVRGLTIVLGSFS